MDLLRRSALRTAGYANSEVRRWVRAGTLTAVRRGTYLTTAPDDPAQWHLAAVRAAVGDLHADAVISHVSAAVVHGFDPWDVPLGRVHATRARRSGGCVAAGLHLHSTPLTPGEVTVVDGVPVTTPARTLVDLARAVAFEQAVAVVDTALRLDAVTPEELDEALARAAGRPGAPAARRAVAFADGRSGSVGESRSRVRMARAGLPAPELQWPVRDGTGAFIAKVDFWFAELGVVGEFDGRVKYGRLLRPGEDPADAVYREKRREDAIRATGPRVVRWGWPEIDEFDTVVARIQGR